MFLIPIWRCLDLVQALREWMAHKVFDCVKLKAQVGPNYEVIPMRLWVHEFLFNLCQRFIPFGTYGGRFSCGQIWSYTWHGPRSMTDCRWRVFWGNAIRRRFGVIYRYTETFLTQLHDNYQILTYTCEKSNSAMFQICNNPQHN